VRRDRDQDFSATESKGWLARDREADEMELTVPDTPDEPFNHDGFWKAVMVSPEDGHLYCVPLAAITCEAVEAPPHLFIWVNDTIEECQDVPGFVCALGTEEDEAAVLRDTAREHAERVEVWRVTFAAARNRART
jgi:hypothetical protein